MYGLHPNVPWYCVIVVHCECFDHFPFQFCYKVREMIKILAMYNNGTTKRHIVVGPNDSCLFTFLNEK